MRLAITLRVQKARLDPMMRIDAWDTSAKVTFDRGLLNELTTLRFLDAHAHVTIVGPVGIGKTFLAHARGHRLPPRRHRARGPYRPDAQDPQACAPR